MEREIITDNASEKIEALWDGTRLGLKHTDQLCLIIPLSTLIVLNPREMVQFIMFGMQIREVKEEMETLGSRLMTLDSSR